MKKIILLTIVLTLSMFCLGAEATVVYSVYSFKQIAEKGDGPIELANGATGEEQLFVTVADFCPGKVLFTFTNRGPYPSSITGVYFDDGALLGISSIDNSCQGVLFSRDATPHNLPGGQNLLPPFETTDGFSADSDPPTQPNGVNPNEWLGITFDLEPDNAYENVINNLNTTQLRIGIQVQGFACGGSESFVNVPEPATISILSVGFSIASLLRKRR